MSGLVSYRKARKANGFKPVGPVDGQGEKKLRAAAYVRVSTEEQAQHGYSIAAQKERLEAACKYHGWTMLPPYVDDGYSGKDLERPAIRRLIQDARKKKFDLVLVYTLDRLSRRVGDLTTVGDMLDKHGVGFRSVTQPFDTTNPTGKLLFYMLGSFAQFERELIGERTKMGLRRRKKEGKWNGLPPFGYRIAKHGGLEPHPQELPYARKVFDLCLHDNMGIKEIARRMRREDHVTRRSRGRWYRNSVWNMLRNPVYTGFVEFDGERVAKHKGIVTPDEFERMCGFGYRYDS